MILKSQIFQPRLGLSAGVPRKAGVPAGMLPLPLPLRKVREALLLVTPHSVRFYALVLSLLTFIVRALTQLPWPSFSFFEINDPYMSHEHPHQPRYTVTLAHSRPQLL
jgi:hypothetical protein